MLATIARPFGQFLMLLYEWVGNYGVSLILFAIVIRFILLPFQMKSKPGLMRQTRLQPKVAEIQKKYATNKARMNEEIAKLYKAEGVNPASGCLWNFLPLPIMFALYLVIRQPLTMMMGIPEDLLQEGGAIFDKLQKLDFVSSIQQYYVQIDQAQWISRFFDQFQSLGIDRLRMLNFNFLGINLGAQPQWDFLWNSDRGDMNTWPQGFVLFLIPLISGVAQFVASTISRKMMAPASTPDGQGKSLQTMMLLMPLMSIYFAFVTPAALGFYWTIGTVLQIGQDIWLNKRYTKKLDAEEAVKNEERIKKEAEIEAKRIESERKKAEGSVERNPNTSKRKKQKSDRQEQLDKAVEWEKKHAPEDKLETYEPSRVGNRRYARGRAYMPDRYSTTQEDDNCRLSDSDEDEDYELDEDDNEDIGEDEDYSGEGEDCNDEND
jgi:YidC/Oxa1 family membrane protein insertase